MSVFEYMALPASVGAAGASRVPAWAKAVAERFGCAVRFLPVGPEDATHGPPTSPKIPALSEKTAHEGSTSGFAARSASTT